MIYKRRGWNVIICCLRRRASHDRKKSINKMHSCSRRDCEMCCYANKSMYYMLYLRYALEKNEIYTSFWS